VKKGEIDGSVTPGGLEHLFWNVARDIVERAYDRRTDEVRSEPTERESSTQGEPVPRARQLHHEEEA